MNFGGSAFVQDIFKGIFYSILFLVSSVWLAVRVVFYDVRMLSAAQLKRRLRGQSGVETVGALSSIHDTPATVQT